MSFNVVPAGEAVPKDIYVIIEIAANANAPIKYEMDKSSGALFVDRFMLAPMFYPCNYGFINHTLAADGDPLDVLVLTPYPLQPGCVIRCRPVALLKMTDDKGDDAKVLAVPHSTLTTAYDNIENVDDVPELLKEQIIHFFTHYKSLEKGKWVKILGWEDIVGAEIAIIEAQTRATICSGKATLT